MKKRIICILLTLCLLMLQGCGQDKETLFCSGFERLLEKTAVHVRNEQYSGKDFDNIELLAVRNEWRVGEDFYWESDDGNRSLCCGGNYWDIAPRHYTEWKQREVPIQSFSKWWTKYEPEVFLSGDAHFARVGEYVVLVQNEDHGSDNCTLSRQISTNYFYMDKDWEIVRITCTMVSYKGAEVDDEQIHSVSQKEYYISFVGADEAQAKIREQYETVVTE